MAKKIHKCEKCEKVTTELHDIEYEDGQTLVCDRCFVVQWAAAWATDDQLTEVAATIEAAMAE